MQESLTNGGNKLTGNHPISDTMLHIKVRLPVQLYTVKTVEGDFRIPGPSLQMYDKLTKKIPT